MSQLSISEVGIMLINNPAKKTLRAFCTITIGEVLAIHDIKLIEGKNGLFVAMPQKEITYKCPNSSCAGKPWVADKYCHLCGQNLAENRFERSPDGKTIVRADVCFPTSNDFRQSLTKTVVNAYNWELLLSLRPDYISAYHYYRVRADGLIDNTRRYLPEQRVRPQEADASFGEGIFDEVDSTLRSVA